MDSGYADFDSAGLRGVSEGGQHFQRSGSPLQAVCSGGHESTAPADLDVAEFCSLIMDSVGSAQAASTERIVIAVEQRRGFSLPLDTPVALCILRFYPGLDYESIVILLTSMRDMEDMQRFLLRMARDTLSVLPSTPASVGTVWRQPVAAALQATPLRTVSRAMKECSWDLSSTINIEMRPTITDPGVFDPIVLYYPPMLPTSNDAMQRPSSLSTDATQSAVRRTPASESQKYRNEQQQLSESRDSRSLLEASEPLAQLPAQQLANQTRRPAVASESAIEDLPSAHCAPVSTLYPRADNPAAVCAAISALTSASTSAFEAVRHPACNVPANSQGTPSSLTGARFISNSDSIVTDTAPQVSSPTAAIDALENCLTQHMSGIPPSIGANLSPSLSELNATSISLASDAARNIDGTGEMSFYVEEYGTSLLRSMPGVHLSKALTRFVEAAPAALHYMDMHAYYSTCHAVISATPLEAREQAAADTPSWIVTRAVERAAGSRASRSPGSGHSAATHSQHEFDAAVARGQAAADQIAVEDQRRYLADERARLQAQGEELQRQVRSLSSHPSSRPQLTWQSLPHDRLAQDTRATTTSTPPVPATGTKRASSSTSPAHDTSPASTAPLISKPYWWVNNPIDGMISRPDPPVPAWYSDTMGGGRPCSHTKLRVPTSVLAGCSFDKSSLKKDALAKADLVILIDCEADDFDSWLPARPEALERLLELYYQRFYISIAGGFDNPSTDPAAIEVAALAANKYCRDMLRDGISLASRLSRVHDRVRKARTADACADTVVMVHQIDQHAVPASEAAISLSIEKRSLRVGEESIESFMEALINTCTGHLTHKEIRKKFMVGVSLALDEAERSGLYDQAKIDNVRDNFLSDDAVLPSDNDALRQKLGRASSTSTVWRRVGSPAGPVRKEARTHVAWQDQAPAPPVVPSAPDVAQELSPQFQQQASIEQQQQNQAHTCYGGGSGYQQQQYGGRGYGGKGYGGGGYQQSYGQQQQQQQFSSFGGDGKGKGKGKGKGGGPPKDPNAPTRFYDFPAIVATGLIWPNDTKLYWNNPARINTDGSGDGLYGMACPLCGKDKKRELDWDSYVRQFGKPPGNGPEQHPQPPDLAVFHRGLGCKEAGWDVARYVRDHPDAPECMKAYMTEGALMAFKAVTA